MGGQHYIYVTRDEYDECRSYVDAFRNAGFAFFVKLDIFQTPTWCSMAMMAPETSILSYRDGVVPTPVTFKLRVDNPYNVETELSFPDLTSNCNTVGGLPVYEFEIDGKQATEIAEDRRAEALGNVNVVPNPYYACLLYTSDAADE